MKLEAKISVIGLTDYLKTTEYEFLKRHSRMKQQNKLHYYKYLTKITGFAIIKDSKRRKQRSDNYEQKKK